MTRPFPVSSLTLPILSALLNSRISLAGAATSIIFSVTKYVFCRDKCVLVGTKVLSRQIRVCRENFFCRDKHNFVEASILLSRQKTCSVPTNMCLSRQRHVATKTIVVAAPAREPSRVFETILSMALKCWLK